MKSEPLHKDLLNQARVFYFETCVKAGVVPFQANQSLSQVESNFIMLKSSKGDLIKIRFTKNFLFLELNGSQYRTDIKQSGKRLKTSHSLYIESELFESFKEQAKYINISVNILIEDLIHAYLKEINKPDPEEPETI